MNNYQCLPSCPKCHGTGHIPETTLLHGHEVLTGVARPCPNAKTLVQIQGLTGKRFDVEFDEFKAWWGETHPAVKYESDHARFCSDYANAGLSSSKATIPDDALLPIRDEDMALCKLYGVRPLAMFMIMRRIHRADPMKPWNAATSPFGWHEYNPIENTTDFLWIQGRAGSGRSSLAGIVLRSRCQKTGLLGAFVSVRKLEAGLLGARKSAWGGSEDMTSAQIAATLARIPHLVLDEWDAASNARSSQDRDGIQPIVSAHLIRILRDRFESRLPTILTSLEHPSSPEGARISPLVPAAATELDCMLRTPGSMATILMEPALLAAQRMMNTLRQGA